MLAGGTGKRKFVFAIALALMLPFGCGAALARAHAHHHHHHRHHHAHAVAHSSRGARHHARHRHHARRPVLQCVTFAREETGLVLPGNAAAWWREANGRYARGSAPEAGAILSFRGTGRIRLGHVAVVSKVVNSREIEVDHSHWGGNRIDRGVSVIDVSPDNDWTKVRVALREGGHYGSVYATNGFIYDRRPGPRILMAGTTAGQPVGHVQQASATEVADAPDPEPPKRHARAHARHRRHRLAARRHGGGEVAMQPRRARLKRHGTRK